LGWSSGARGTALGLDVGVEIVSVDVMVSFTQLLGGGHGTVTYATAGTDVDIPIDGLVAPKTFFRLGGETGFAFVTRQPLDLPLDKPQVSHMGFVANTTVAIEHYLNGLLAVGMQFSGGYHYFVRGGDVRVNESLGGTHGGQFSGMVTFTAHLDPMRW
jgi:hypothetical protein